MSENPEKPIFSSLRQSPELDERIERFVIELGARVDDLQDLEVAGDYPGLERDSLALGKEARELGYEPLEDAARRVATACSEKNPAAVRKSVSQLTGISNRVRRGHRCAA